MEPFTIESLTDDEVTKCFVAAPLHMKPSFLNELKKRGIQSVVIDLELEQSLDETFQKYCGDKSGLSSILNQKRQQNEKRINTKN